MIHAADINKYIQTTTIIYTHIYIYVYMYTCIKNRNHETKSREYKGEKGVTTLDVMMIIIISVHQGGHGRSGGRSICVHVRVHTLYKYIYTYACMHVMGIE